MSAETTLDGNPSAAALTGSEQFAAIQSNADVTVTVDQVTALMQDELAFQPLTIANETGNITADYQIDDSDAYINWTLKPTVTGVKVALANATLLDNNHNTGLLLLFGNSSTYPCDLYQPDTTANPSPNPYQTKICTIKPSECWLVCVTDFSASPKVVAFNLSSIGQGLKYVTLTDAQSDTDLEANTVYFLPPDLTQVMQLTLPETANVGDVIQLLGYGANANVTAQDNWQVIANIGQQIYFNEAVSNNTEGTLQPLRWGSRLTLRCLDETNWLAESAAGQFNLI